jgi:hypothetical protein
MILNCQQKLEFKHVRKIKKFSLLKEDQKPFLLEELKLLGAVNFCQDSDFFVI